MPIGIDSFLKSNGVLTEERAARLVEDARFS